MKGQAKFITSHTSRVQRAEMFRERSPEKISVFDREALVEYYLLEDITRLYRYRLQQANEKLARGMKTPDGIRGTKKNIEKYKAVIAIFECAMELAWCAIEAGNYKVVWSSIPEGPLMAAAKDLKYLPQLRDLSIKLMRDLLEEATFASEEWSIVRKDIDALVAHVKKAREEKAPQSSDAENAIAAIKRAIAD